MKFDFRVYFNMNNYVLSNLIKLPLSFPWKTIWSTSKGTCSGFLKENLKVRIFKGWNHDFCNYFSPNSNF